MSFLFFLSLGHAEYVDRSRQINMEDGSNVEDSIPKLTKADFRKPPGTVVRDWVAKLVG